MTSTRHCFQICVNYHGQLFESEREVGRALKRRNSWVSGDVINFSGGQLKCSLYVGLVFGRKRAILYYLPILVQHKLNTTEVDPLSDSLPLSNKQLSHTAKYLVE